MSVPKPVVDYTQYRITVGCDPELFLYDKKARRFVSGHDIIPGTKKHPHELYKSMQGGKCQADGTAAEFNIEPATSLHSFIRNVGDAVCALHQQISHTSLSLAPVSVAVFDKEYFESLPNSAKELGCDPDYDAYNGGKPNPRPTSLPIASARTGAGHIAVGWRRPNELVKDPFEAAHFADCIMMVQMMDEIHEHLRPWYETPNDEYRRLLYGKRGAFRPKPFGVEYRTPSNGWLLSSAMARNMWVMSYTAFVLLSLGYIPGTPQTAAVIKSMFSKTAVNHYIYLPEVHRPFDAFRNPAASATDKVSVLRQYNHAWRGLINSRDDFVVPAVDIKAR